METVRQGAPEDFASDLHGQTYTTAKTIAAIQSCAPGLAPCGPVVQLPRDTKLLVIGPGFHNDLVKVRSNTGSYFVFREDLL